MMSNTYVLIPAYNEEKSIGHILRTIKKWNYTILVIDDASTDTTPEIIQGSNAILLKQKFNKGSGEAVRLGLKYLATIKKKNSIVILDADGQHDPNVIPLLLKQINIGADYVIASRYLKPTEHTTSLPRRMGTHCISLLLYLLYGKKITDPTSGFRAMNLKTFQYLLPIYPTVFSEPEVVIALLEKKFNIEEISCQMNKRKHGKSSISSKKALLLMFYILVKICSTFCQRLTKLYLHRH